MSLLVLMGSGETAPAMVQVHRQVLAAGPAHHPVLIDTPFGFQVNADGLTARTANYFRESVGTTVEVVSWRSRDEDRASQHAALALLAKADWVFAGPGSPTYALAHWHGTDIPAAMSEVLHRGGALVLGSAAAVTVGAYALPVYEIYKVGATPEWVPGLDILSRYVGLSAAVIPHFNNAEGGTYDTRYCYLGEQRLRVLEKQLPEGACVLGVDEHTAVVFDLATRTLDVLGSGVLTIRRHGRSRVIASGSTMKFDDLVAMASAESVDSDEDGLPTSSGSNDGAPGPAPSQPSLLADVARLRQQFDTGLDKRDVDACVAAIVDLEQTLHAWSADTLQSDEADRGRRELKLMVVRLGELAKVGAIDPRERIEPFVEALIEQRSRFRDGGDFATSDRIRALLAEAGVAVNDTAAGTNWELIDSEIEH